MSVAETSRIRVAVVCASAITCLGYTLVADGQAGLVFVGSYETSADALDGLTRTPADVLIVDYANDLHALGCRDDLDDAHQVQLLKQKFPRLAIVVTSMRRDSITVSHAMNAGALCYVHKSRPVPELAHAIRVAASGKSFVDTYTISTDRRSRVGIKEPDFPVTFCRKESDVRSTLPCSCLTMAINEKSPHARDSSCLQSMSPAGLCLCRWCDFLP